MNILSTFSPRARHMSVRFICWLVLVSASLSVAAQETGGASYYNDKFQNGMTASGEKYNRSAFTGAHKTHPFGTRVRVTNLANGRSVVVRINDRGPYTKGRVIDLSFAAAEQLDMLRAGVAQVRLEVVQEAPGTSGEGVLSGEPQASDPGAGSWVDISKLPVRDENGVLISPSEPQAGPAAGVGPSGGTPISDPLLADARTRTPAMYQMWAVRGQADGYGVQIGAFGSYYRMLDVLNELGQQEVINTLVHSDIKNDKPVFRIIVGPFPTRPEAEAARKKLQALKMNGIVVELASLPQ